MSPVSGIVNRAAKENVSGFRHNKHKKRKKISDSRARQKENGTKMGFTGRLLKKRVFKVLLFAFAVFCPLFPAAIKANKQGGILL